MTSPGDDHQGRLSYSRPWTRTRHSPRSATGSTRIDAASRSDSGGLSALRRFENVLLGEVPRLRGYPPGVTSVPFSPDGRYVVRGAGTRSSGIRVLETAEEARRCRGRRLVVWSIADERGCRRIVSRGTGMTVRLRVFATGEPFATLLGHTNRAYSVAFSPDGRQAAEDLVDSRR